MKELLDGFNLEQLVTGATHIHGIALDLVLSYNLHIDNVSICDSIVSDHSLIVFICTLNDSVNAPQPTRFCRSFKADTVARFSSVFSTMNNDTAPAILDTGINDHI